MVEKMDPVHCSSPVEFMGPAIPGYNDILPLSTDEFDCLYYLVLIRSVQSALIGMNSFRSLIGTSISSQLYIVLICCSEPRIWKSLFFSVRL